MKKFIRTMFIVLLFLSGLSLLLYPFIANKWNDYRQKQLLTSYEETIEKEAESIDYTSEWERAQAYNEALLPAILPDSFAIAAASEEPDEEYMSCLNLAGDGMMGYVEIPKIDVKIPIFHTVKTEIMEKAAGHLEGSSLPVGGGSTHAVISAHRGLPSATLFTDLDKLEKGDHFLISVLDNILCYEVDHIAVVEPTRTDDLAVQEGQDLVTLLTCTPYGVNSHRLLVRGHRVPYEPEKIDRLAEEEKPSSISSIIGPSFRTNYLLWVVIGLTVTAIFILVLFIREQKLEKRAEQRKRRRNRLKNKRN